MTKILCFFLIFVVACQKPTSTLQSAPTATAAKSIERKPVSIAQKGKIRVGVYDFAAFKPFLNPPNDTLYVINFWATWCSPCVAELPHFQQLHQNYKDQKVKVILVSLDFLKQLESKLIPFLEKEALGPEVLVLDQKGVNEWMGLIDSTWSGAIPATLFCKGNKKQFYEQSFDYTALETAMKGF